MLNCENERSCYENIRMVGDLTAQDLAEFVSGKVVEADDGQTIIDEDGNIAFSRFEHKGKPHVFMEYQIPGILCLDITHYALTKEYARVIGVAPRDTIKNEPEGKIEEFSWFCVFRKKEVQFIDKLRETISGTRCMSIVPPLIKTMAARAEKNFQGSIDIIK